ncbi:MAG: hypothetical protein HPY57_14550 [Ignavibacteria bacterium]|nr:hypothetical protein [Ignavibacteria bacterium]
MIIGISGKICSGKTEVAKYIQKTFPKHNFQIRSFGYDVKFIASYITGIDINLIQSREIKSKYLPEWGMTLGEMYQKIGTDCMRIGLHPDTWVFSLMSKYTLNQNWVIDDVRFRNEADAIKQAGGLMIRLEGDPLNIRNKDPRDMNHVSETALDNYEKFDIIYNNVPPIESIDNLIKLLKI